MITLFVFYIHTIAAITAFTKRWQESGWGDGLLGVMFVVLVFSVGWSMSTFIVKLFMNEKGFGIWFDRDAASLVLLTVVEGAFLLVQTKRKKRRLASV